jgi:hypothetical protein
LTSSTDGRLGAEGKRFRTLCTKPIGTVVGGGCSRGGGILI